MKLKKLILLLIDIALSPFSLLSAIVSKFITLHRFPIADQIFAKVGVLPVRDHYYQPLINPRKYLLRSLRDDRPLPAIDFNIAGQLEFLSGFDYNKELIAIPLEKPAGHHYYYNMDAFGSGDSEYLYNMIRYVKPRNIIEIGSGSSTLMTINALEQNRINDKGYSVEHICVEPYENAWLETTSAKIVRRKVETLDIDFFKKLQGNDILFIDSSHVIRPQGDVLFEYLEILPMLNPGVFIHIHDIFSPKDYPDEWVLEQHSLWNEQYLLEAFLSFNNDFEIIGALNYLHHNHREKLAEKCPVLASQPFREPGSFWIRRK